MLLTESEFRALAAEGYNRVPLIREAFADLDTPFALPQALPGPGTEQLLAGVRGRGERFGRYSFVGLPARTLVRTTGELCEVLTDGQVVETHTGNPLDFVSAYQERYRPKIPEGLPRFFAGAWPATSATRPCVPSRSAWRAFRSPMASARPTSCCCWPKRWPSSTTSPAAST